jgi:hypothetical protein
LRRLVKALHEIVAVGMVGSLAANVVIGAWRLRFSRRRST